MREDEEARNLRFQGHEVHGDTDEALPRGKRKWIPSKVRGVGKLRRGAEGARASRGGPAARPPGRWASGQPAAASPARDGESGGPHLVRVQVGVGLAQTVQEGFRVPAQRLPGGEEVGAADVEPDPLGHPAGALGQGAETRTTAAAQAGPQPRPEAARGRRQHLAVILRHDPSKPRHRSSPPEASGL